MTATAPEKEMIRVSVGEVSPMTHAVPGAAISFAFENIHLSLQIPDLRKMERRAIYKGRVRVGIYPGEPGRVGAFVWEFYDPITKKPISFETPFHAATEQEGARAFVDPDMRHHYLVSLFVVDANNVIEYMRAFTIGPELSTQFYKACKAQLAVFDAGQWDNEHYIEQSSELFERFPQGGQLIKACTVIGPGGENS